jgi:metal-responsive CopG/Arc/MetJ family transcriptional regulator
MKPIQVMMDEQLLRRLEETAEVRKHGRSAVMRRAVEEYLRRSRSRRISEAYRKAYSTGGGLGGEFQGWEREARWPEK